jgi:type II secretory pathway pseudopilin PulG
VALVLVTVLGAVGVTAVRSAVSAISRVVAESEATAAELTADSILRKAFSRFPPAFWRPVPTLTESAGVYTVSDGNRYSVSLTIAKSGSGLIISWDGTSAYIPGVTAVAVKPSASVKPAGAAGSNGAAGYSITLTLGRRTSEIVVDYGGLRL